jgi:hypothetical protein
MYGGDGCRCQSTSVDKQQEPNVKERCQSTSVDKQQEPNVKESLLDNTSNLLTNMLNGGSLGNMHVAEACGAQELGAGGHGQDYRPEGSFMEERRKAVWWSCTRL